MKDSNNNIQCVYNISEKFIEMNKLKEHSIYKKFNGKEFYIITSKEVIDLCTFDVLEIYIINSKGESNGIFRAKLHETDIPAIIGFYSNNVTKHYYIDGFLGETGEEVKYYKMKKKIKIIDTNYEKKLKKIKHASMMYKIKNGFLAQ